MHTLMLLPLQALLWYCCVLIPAGYARDIGANPEINRPYLNPDIKEWVQRFETEGREVYDKRHEIVTATGVKPGMVVADVGAGTGLFTRLFSAKVGRTGKVIAVDISKPFIENILRTSKSQGLDNIIGLVNTQTDTRLSPNSVDLVFISDTYHHFELPIPIMQSIHRALRPGGTVVVIDFKRAEGFSSPWVMEHVRGGKEEVIKEIEAQGFKLIEDKDFLRDNYFLKFRKLDLAN